MNKKPDHISHTSTAHSTDEVLLSTTTGALAGFLVHHALFWLHRPDSREDLQCLIDGLNSLRDIESILTMHVGVPANTEQRDVVDASYQVSEIMVFKNEEDQAAYQCHPIHKKFVDQCSNLWRKVVVYDAIEVEN